MQFVSVSNVDTRHEIKFKNKTGVMHIHRISVA